MNRLLVATAIVLTIAGCGGGGSSSPTVATGQFKDSNASGINYVSGRQSGVTGTNGSFTYEAGGTVTFSVGGVTLGTSTGKSVVTPVDLVASGSTSSTSVQNIVRFLMMLDSDANPANGISVSSNVQTNAETWAQLDFGSAGFDSAASSVIASVTAADGRSASLPAANVAQTHLESTLRCSYAGAYKGTYTGGGTGNFGVMVDATTGNVTGVAYNDQNSLISSVSGTSPIAYDQTAAFVSGITSTGGYFSGSFTSVNGVSGTWSDSGNSGTFSGSRIGGSTSAAYRFTGGFSGDDYGLFSIDVDSANNATGVGYSVSYDEVFQLNGSLSGTTITATASNGASITGILNTSTGSLSGSWINSNSNPASSGLFSGSGCKLN